LSLKIQYTTFVDQEAVENFVTFLGFQLTYAHTLEEYINSNEEHANKISR